MIAPFCAPQCPDVWPKHRHKLNHHGDQIEYLLFQPQSLEISLSACLCPNLPSFRMMLRIILNISNPSACTSIQGAKAKFCLQKIHWHDFFGWAAVWAKWGTLYCVATPLIVPKYPCHTQMVKRGVKMVTKASSKVFGKKERDGYVRHKNSRTVVPEFRSNRMLLHSLLLKP